MSQEITAPNAGATSFFVGSQIDDLGLNPFQFRVLGHLHRRAGSDGLAWPSLASISATCQICRPVVQRTLRELVKLDLITATVRPGQSTLYRPVPRTAPSQDVDYPPSQDVASEGIPLKEFQQTPPPPPERVPDAPEPQPERVAVVGGADRPKPSKTVQMATETPLDAEQGADAVDAVADTLGGYGIVGAKQRALSRCGLTAIEVKRICRRVSEGGGRAGAMVMQLEAQAGRKSEGLVIVGAVDHSPRAAPLPEWADDDMSTDERAELVSACRKFREAC